MNKKVVLGNFCGAIRGDDSQHFIKEMKKLIVLSLAAVMLLGSVNVVADAKTPAELRDQLVSLGVPVNSADNLVAYLQTVDLSAADKSEIEGLVKQAYAIVGDRTDLTKLSNEEKQQLVGLANKAAAKVGLVVNYSKFEGGNSITITTKKGETLVSLDSKVLHNVLKNFDGDMAKVVELAINGAVQVVVTPSNVSTSVTPTPGSGLNNTGAQLPTVIIAGAGLVVLAAGLMVTSQRKLQD